MLILVYFFEFLSMGKTLGPPQVSEETSTWWGNLPYPRPPGRSQLVRLLWVASHGGKCRTGHAARLKRRPPMWYDALVATGEVHGQRARHETSTSDDISRHGEGGVNSCHQAAHRTDCYRERGVGAAVRALPTDAKMVDSRAHRRIADYAVSLSRDRVQAGGVARRSHDRL